jgi:hypothetical protein
MRTIIVIAFVCLALNTLSEGQGEPKPTLGTGPLSAEKVAIYRIVLADYRKGTKDALNLADRTEPLQRSEGSSDLGCISGIKLADPNSAPALHRIDSSTALGPGLVLVDPDRQQERINENDPQNLVKRAIDDHEQVTDKQLDDSIKRAFETGLFTLSEIAFHEGHRYAVVAYSFVCGGLCGNGKTLLLKKVGHKWRVIKACGEWVS